MNPSRRALLAGFLALPAAAKLGVWAKPAPQTWWAVVDEVAARGDMVVVYNPCYMGFGPGSQLGWVETKSPA